MTIPTPVRPDTEAHTTGCVDAMQRRRNIASYTTQAGVVLLPPPGEAAVLTPRQARELAQTLLDHASTLEHQRGQVAAFPRD